jgi:N-formylglutamate amidohydrolase
VIRAEVSRLVVDLNRALSQREPKGLIALVDYHGRPVYREGMVPGPQEISERVRKYYDPYHRKLAEILDRDDIIGFFDCHSLNGFGPPEAPDAGRKRRDIVLGNNGDGNGRVIPGAGPLTCPEDTFREIAAAFRIQGFSVSLNDPYAGGYITTHYGKGLMEKGKFAVQIEINQDLYVCGGRPVCDPNRTAKVKERVFSALSNIAYLF